MRAVPTASGRFVTVLDDRSPGWGREGGPVTAIAADGLGNVYFTEGTRILVSRREPLGFAPPATIVDLEAYGISVGGMAVDEFGRIWFSDPEHRRVRVLEPVR